MSGDAPWWASGADALDDSVDPLTAHQEARATGLGGDGPAAGSSADGGTPPRDAWDVPWEDWDDRDPPPPSGGQRSTVEDAFEGLAALARFVSSRRGRSGVRPHGRDETCRACPWCLAMRSLGDVRPEVVEHLDEAMRHLVAAARAWVDAAEDRGPWQRIELDDDGGRP